MKKPIELVEERWNAYSHGIGIALGVLGAYFLFSRQIQSTNFWSILIYSASNILLFTASTWYHSATHPPLKRKLRILDHISIYYLIAGTYTPISIWVLKDSNGILLLWLVWGIAIFGTFLKLFFTGRFEVFSLMLYGIMGWLIVIDFTFLIEQMNYKGLLYLAIGGAFYTLGMFFYAYKRIPYNHLIWHFFVLGGAISHWFMIYSILS